MVNIQLKTYDNMSFGDFVIKKNLLYYGFKMTSYTLFVEKIIFLSMVANLFVDDK